jgi:hypothetical protein
MHVRQLRVHPQRDQRRGQLAIGEAIDVVERDHQPLADLLRVLGQLGGDAVARALDRAGDVDLDPDQPHHRRHHLAVAGQRVAGRVGGLDHAGGLEVVGEVRVQRAQERLGARVRGGVDRHHRGVAALADLGVDQPQEAGLAAAGGADHPDHPRHRRRLGARPADRRARPAVRGPAGRRPRG